MNAHYHRLETVYDRKYAGEQKEYYEKKEKDVDNQGEGMLVFRRHIIMMNTKEMMMKCWQGMIMLRGEADYQ